MIDPELRALLIEELRRHAATLGEGSLDTDQLRTVLHAVKGTAGVAGESTLSETFARLERCQHSGAAEQALRSLQSAIKNLEQGRPAIVDTWPIPPRELQASFMSPALAARYEADMRDRAAALDAIVCSNADLQQRLSEALRHIHAMKGAAAAVADDAMTWFCHGLETRLRGASDDQPTCQARVEQLAVWRPVLLGLVDDPVGTLEVLRGASGHTVDPPTETKQPTARPDGEELLHVPAQMLDMALERLRRVCLASRDVHGQGEAARRAARSMRLVRQQLLESRRMIGPPRPWGAPMAALDGIENATRTLGVAAVELEHIAAAARRGARTIGQAATTSQNELGSVRRATMALVFDRVGEAIQTSAEQRGVEIRVETTGASTPLDRRLAEALIDPLLQLARNAVAHGIESPSLRMSIGKPTWGHVLLSAEVRGAHLLVGVRDDGAGVDVDALRADTIRTGQLTHQSARDISDEGLLNLLFLPGITTRSAADVLAGRGLGLDVSLHTARRLGGTIRIRNRPGRGLTAVVDVPLVERGQARVLWVRSLGHRFALTARYVRRVRVREQEEVAPPALATSIDARLLGHESGYVIDIGRSIDERLVPFSVGAIEDIEEATVRPVPPLVALAGPYVGVIVAADGHPSLLIDAMLVSDRASRIRQSRASSFPPLVQNKP